MKLIRYESETLHPQVRIVRGDWKADVDELLAPFILMLWHEGIETVMSCQDWVAGNTPGSAMVAFAKVADARKVQGAFGGTLSLCEYESDKLKQDVADDYAGTAPEAVIFWPTEFVRDLLDQLRLSS